MWIGDVSTNAELKQTLLNKWDGLNKANHEGDFATVARIIWRWVGTIGNYSGLELLLPHEGHLDVVNTVRSLLRFEGGLWCGGMARLYSGILRLFPVPAAVLQYGYSGKYTDMSHATTVYGAFVALDGFEKRSFSFYIRDAYLGYYYTGRQGEIMDVATLYGHVANERYEEIIRVDEPATRHLLLPWGGDPTSRLWLFKDREAPVPRRVGDIAIYPGAVHTVDKLFAPNSPMVRLSDELRGDLPLEHFLLDWMLHNTLFGRMSPDCPKCYQDYVLARSVIRALGRKR